MYFRSGLAVFNKLFGKEFNAEFKKEKFPALAIKRENLSIHLPVHRQERFDLIRKSYNCLVDPYFRKEYLSIQQSMGFEHAARKMTDFWWKMELESREAKAEEERQQEKEKNKSNDDAPSGDKTPSGVCDINDPD